MNLTGSVDLLRLELAGVATIKGKKCLVIPIEENDLYIAMDENLKAKAAYLGLAIFERREVSKFGSTHTVKQSFSKAKRESSSKEEIDQKPYLGDMKPIVFESKNGSAAVSAPVETPDAKDDLPF